jgi:hypothetical protein
MEIKGVKIEEVLFHMIFTEKAFSVQRQQMLLYQD